MSDEFWYGLKNMHCLTSREPMEVEVEVSQTDSTKLLLHACPMVNFKLKDPALAIYTHCKFLTSNTLDMTSLDTITLERNLLRRIGPAETLA